MNIAYLKSVPRNFSQGISSSLHFFSPDHLKTVLFLIFKTFKRETLTFFKFFILPILPLGIATYLDLLADGEAYFASQWEYIRPLFNGTIGGLSLANIIITAFVVYGAVLSARASLEPKSKAYFLQALFRFPPFLLLFIVLPHFFLFPVFLLSVFFFLDTSFSFKGFFNSLINGVGCTLYFLPLFVAFGGVSAVLFHATQLALPSLLFKSLGTSTYFVSYTIRFLLSLLYYLFFVATVTTLYTRIKYTHPTFFLITKSKEAPRRYASRPTRRRRPTRKNTTSTPIARENIKEEKKSQTKEEKAPSSTTKRRPRRRTNTKKKGSAEVREAAASKASTIGGSTSKK